MSYYKIQNQYKTRIFIILALALLVVPSAYATEVTKQIAPGVSLYQEINTAPNSALIINAVTVDFANPAVKVKPALGGDVVYVNNALKGREIVSSATARKGAVVGINADFFPFTGDPLGICVIDDELVSEPARNRAVIGVTRDSTLVFDNPILDAEMVLPSGANRQIDGINRARETNQAILYTNTWGQSTKSKYKGTDVVLASTELPVKIGKSISFTVSEVKVDALNTPIPKDGVVISAGGPAGWFLKENVKRGDTVSIRFDVKSTNNADWTQVGQAVGGGPWLVKNGQVFVDATEEGFDRSFSSARHPRTAIGATVDGKLLLVTVDGRQSISRGISLPDMAALMKRLGAVNAINLDGGGSTTMCIKGLVINSPCEGRERPVADSFLVYSDQSLLNELPKLSICGLEGQIVQGEGRQLFVTWGDESQVLTEEQQQNVVWGTTNGLGFVNQKGYFTPLRSGEGKVKALYGTQLITSGVNVITGVPAKLAVELVPDQQNIAHATIKVTVYDAASKPLSGRDVALKATGGTLDVNTAVTDDKGECSAVVNWDPNATEHSVSATSGSISGSTTLH